MRNVVKIGFTWLVLLASVTSGLAQAKSLGATRSVQVRGQASIAVKPDKLVFYLTLEQRGETASKLFTAIQSKADTIVNFLLGQGVAERDIQAMQMQLAPWYERTGEGRQHKGLQFRRTIQVELRDIDKYPMVLDGVSKVGIDRLDGFSYQVDDERSIYLRAMEKAIADANARANVMMKALGYKTQGVISVQENAVYQPMPKMAAMTRGFADAESGHGGQLSNLPGLIQITADVDVQFEIAPN